MEGVELPSWFKVGEKRQMNPQDDAPDNEDRDTKTHLVETKARAAGRRF